jgi:hypothetical protein
MDSAIPFEIMLEESDWSNVDSKRYKQKYIGFPLHAPLDIVFETTQKGYCWPL